MAEDFANRDISRIVGNITLLLIRRAPYLDILDGGTFQGSISDEQRSIVMERPYLNQSMTTPVFINDTDVCGMPGEIADVGSTEYTTRIATLRGRGPKVCIKQMYSAFQLSYAATQDALQKQILQLMNCDVRSTLVSRSGVKAVVNSTKAPEQMITGDSQLIDVPFASGFMPDTALNFRLLKYFTDFMHEDLLCEPFESERGAVAKFLGSQQIIESMRNELQVSGDLRALTTGEYQVGEEGVTAYTWEGPYRGIVFGIDQQPLRYNVVGADGFPTFVDPELEVQVSKGKAARTNPAWRNAKNEIAFLIFANAFMRQAPEQYSGTGDFKFPAQYSQGELEFVVIRDNDCNTFGDFGNHLYQITRAYKPQRPHAVMAIAFQRCALDFGLAPCTPYSGLPIALAAGATGATGTTSPLL